MREYWLVWNNLRPQLIEKQKEKTKRLLVSLGEGLLLLSFAPTPPLSALCVFGVHMISNLNDRLVIFWLRSDEKSVDGMRRHL